MNQAIVRRITGLCGVLTATLLIVQVPLYFIYSGPPPDGNVLTRILIGVLAFMAFIALANGLRELVRRAAPAHQWAGNLAASAGLTYITITLVSMGLETGAVIASDTPIDPTVDVPGTYILYGTIGRATLALFLSTLGYLILRTGILARWTAVTAIALAAINVAFVPSIFFGNDPSNFYAANGWGSTATVGALLSYWLLAFGISLLRSARRHTDLPAVTPQPVAA